jgi:2-amino-4-hydroxy-6-hydroxymethyldihydropteridine diphosphokinase
MPELAFLSIGSNIGDREANSAGATTALGTYYQINNIQSSSYYETAPLINTKQPNFLNAVLSCETDFTSFALLDTIQQVESILGRPVTRKKNQPRTIDIDIVTHGDAVIQTNELTIPHPEILNRKFILIPLEEIAPNFEIPLLKMTATECLEITNDISRVVKHVMEKQA